MDPGNLESSHWVRPGKSGLRSLLCRSDGDEAASHWSYEVRKRFQADASSGSAAPASQEKEADGVLRELHERLVPPGRAHRIHPAGLPDDAGRVPASVPDLDKTLWPPAG